MSKSFRTACPLLALTEPHIGYRHAVRPEPSPCFTLYARAGRSSVPVPDVLRVKPGSVHAVPQQAHDRGTVPNNKICPFSRINHGHQAPHRSDDMVTAAVTAKFP